MNQVLRRGLIEPLCDLSEQVFAIVRGYVSVLQGRLEVLDQRAQSGSLRPIMQAQFVALSESFLSI